MIKTMPPFMTAAISENNKAAIAAATYDCRGWTGICVGMDTSAASPDQKLFVDQVLTGLVDQDQSG
jgi:hypothetical protein